MIDPELLEILVCPESKVPVSLAEAELIRSLNAAIEAGTVVSLDGSPVRAPIDGGLVREGGDRLYPIREGIPVMLMDEAISLPLAG